MPYLRGDKRNKRTRAHYKVPEVVPYTGDKSRFKLTHDLVRKVRRFYNYKKWPIRKIQYMLWKKEDVIISCEALWKVATRRSYKYVK